MNQAQVNQSVDQSTGRSQSFRTPHNTPVLMTVAQMSEAHPAFSQAALRNLIFLSQERESSKGKIPGNGLAAAIVRIGRKILIDEAKFFAWVEAQNKSQAA